MYLGVGYCLGIWQLKGKLSLRVNSYPEVSCCLGDWAHHRGKVSLIWREGTPTLRLAIVWGIVHLIGVRGEG